jgi:benzoyl-CoA reductase/2-hydroxyglutaryl-CoA dehydratase subunit BcrC/BadD/HgdB
VGAFVAADDLACCGRRLYPPGKSEQPFRRMAERLLNSPPDSTRGDSIEARCDHLLQLVQMSGARGVVFYEVKFCEPELFDLPLLRKALATAEVPAITVEMDINEPLPQRVLTRLEAFVEMIA